MTKTVDPWNERYGGADYYYGVEPNDFLREHAAAIRPGGRVLCLAEGEGRNAVHLARQGLDVTAVDGSQAGLDKLARLAAERGVKAAAVRADLADYRIEPGFWDAIVSIWCHVPEELRRTLHRDCVAGLKPGGVFILEAYRPAQIGRGAGGPQNPALMPTAEALRRELDGLSFEIRRELDRDVQEGRGHGGSSAVVQVLARKGVSS
ncbi:MAG: class I SAM-dependent methyltransferase [Elusimicrobia bacterium]|nr:class I SAM-dependent methyltransferase [Elusimicrobiota bacterium]